MKRREFITLLGGAASWPFAARAQQRAFPVIGLLSSRSPAVDTPLIAVIRQALNETGLIEGQNVTLDYRWAEGQYDRLAGVAADLVRPSGRHCYNSWRDIGPGAQRCDHAYTDRLRGRLRPDQERPRDQPAPSRRQHHGCQHVYRRDGAEAAGITA